MRKALWFFLCMKGIQNRIPFIVIITDSYKYCEEFIIAPNWLLLHVANLVLASNRQIQNWWIIRNASDNGIAPSSKRWVYNRSVIDASVINQAIEITVG